MINLIQPLPIKHMMTPPSKRDRRKNSIFMRMRKTNGVVSTSRETPVDDLLIVDLWLLVNPVEQTTPLSVGARDVAGEGGRVAGPRDLDNDGRDTLLAPAFLPARELGAVPVEAGED